MHGVASQKGIELLDLDFLGLEFFISRRGIARRRFTLFPSFGTFDGHYFAGHK